MLGSVNDRIFHLHREIPEFGRQIILEVHQIIVFVPKVSPCHLFFTRLASGGTGQTLLSFLSSLALPALYR
jgi:hypothetical protein